MTDKNKKDERKQSLLPAFIFYPLAILFFEFLLRVLDNYNGFWDFSIVPMALFSLAFGDFLAFLFLLIRPAWLSRILSFVILLALWLVFCIEFDCNRFYKIYYGLVYSVSMTGQVMGDFSSVVWSVAAQYAFEEFLFFIPVIFFLIFQTKIIPHKKSHGKFIALALLIALDLQVGASMVSRFSSLGSLYTYDFTVFNSVPKIGLLNTFRLELTYLVTGTPEADIEEEYTLWSADSTNDSLAVNETFDNTNTEESIQNDETDSNDNQFFANTDNKEDNIEDNTDINEDHTADNEENNSETKPIVYDYNACVDFASLIENENNGKVKKMHEYFGSLEPSMQNEYTGLFEGKNLIYITAEAFCPYAIDENFTPTLYKLSHEGFVFNNYYQPSWSLSTTGGEFANLTGVIPEWIDSGNSFTVSAYNYMPYSPAGLFTRKGYICKAYHNNSFDYYDRDKTHPNLGYDYKGIGNGLVLEHRTWPYSDLEMMEATVDEMISGYKETGIPFHTYYMTVSGHCNYNWGGNAMSKKNKEAAQEAFPDSSSTVQAYMACNLELEYALKYLMERLDDEGILDDTVICMTADHYPYAMSEGNVDYYVELSGIDDNTRSISRYQNTLILYCSSMEESVIVDTPCYSVDIVPTLNNLFGLEYDSRLYSGRDIFATNYEADKVSSAMPLVIIPVGNRYSFVTAAGSYDAITKEFTPNEGIEVEEEYVKKTQDLIRDKWIYAKLIITNNYYRKVFPEE